MDETTAIQSEVTNDVSSLIVDSVTEDLILSTTMNPSQQRRNTNFERRVMSSYNLPSFENEGGELSNVPLELLDEESAMRKRMDLLQLFEVFDQAEVNQAKPQQRFTMANTSSVRNKISSTKFIINTKSVDELLLRVTQHVRAPRYSHKPLPMVPPRTTYDSLEVDEPRNESCVNQRERENSIVIPIDDDVNGLLYKTTTSSNPSSTTNQETTLSLLSAALAQEIPKSSSHTSPTEGSPVVNPNRFHHTTSLHFPSTLTKFAKPKSATRIKEKKTDAPQNSTAMMTSTVAVSSVGINSTLSKSPNKSKLSSSPYKLSNLLGKTLKHKNSKAESPKMTKVQSPPTTDELPALSTTNASIETKEENSPPLGIPRSRFIGPHVIDFVSELTFSEYNNCSLVHLAARYNHIEILYWLTECCCDEGCIKSPKGNTPPTPPSENISHSKRCMSRQKKLWFMQDGQGLTPLFYCVAPSADVEHAHDSCVFLCSQPDVQERQINYSPDQHGNLPIVIALRRGDFALCDILQLFGAKLDVTVGVGVLGESLLHGALRDQNMDMTEYLCKHLTRLVLKRNQKEENALFACLRDFRSGNTPSSNSSSNLLELSVVRRKENCNTEKRRSSTESLPTRKGSKHCQFLKEILTKGTTLFGVETFEKALSMKNSFGNNLLMQAVVYNDVDSFKTICRFLFEYCNKSVNRAEKAKLLSLIAFDRNKDGKNILHLSIEFCTRLMNKNAEEFIAWFNGFEWLFVWLEQNFLCHNGELTTGQSQSLYSFMIQKDNTSKSVVDLVNSQDLTRSEWKYVKEAVSQASDKWSKDKSMVGSASDLSCGMEKPGIISFFKNRMKKNK